MAEERSTQLSGSTGDRGETNVDPTLNVLQLVEAAVRRLDDLATMRGDFTDRIIRADAEKINAISQLRAEYIEKLSLAESRRIDAIRAVDVGAVATASEKTAQQANVLASQMAASFETLRSLITTTSVTTSDQLHAASLSLDKRISELEKTAYVGSGKQALSEPMISELVNEIRILREATAIGQGRATGASVMWAYITAAVMALLGIGSLVLMVIHINGGKG